MKDGIAFGRPVERGFGGHGGGGVSVELGSSTSSYGFRLWTSDHFQALIRMDIPDTDGTVARSRNDLVLVELAAVNAIGVTGEIDCRRLAFFPLFLDRPPRLIEFLPVPARLDSRSADAPHLKWRRLHMDSLLVSSEEYFAPDVRRRCHKIPGLRHAFGRRERLRIEVGEDDGRQLCR